MRNHFNLKNSYKEILEYREKIEKFSNEIEKFRFESENVELFIDSRNWEKVELFVCEIVRKEFIHESKYRKFIECKTERGKFKWYKTTVENVLNNYNFPLTDENISIVTTQLNRLLGKANKFVNSL